MKRVKEQILTYRPLQHIKQNLLRKLGARRNSTQNPALNCRSIEFAQRPGWNLYLQHTMTQLPRSWRVNECQSFAMITLPYWTLTHQNPMVSTENLLHYWCNLISWFGNKILKSLSVVMFPDIPTQVICKKVLFAKTVIYHNVNYLFCTYCLYHLHFVGIKLIKIYTLPIPYHL